MASGTCHPFDLTSRIDTPLLYCHMLANAGLHIDGLRENVPSGSTHRVKESISPPIAAHNCGRAAQPWSMPNHQQSAPLNWPSIHGLQTA